MQNQRKDEALLESVRSGLFVSDLHLFSPRSIGQRAIVEIAQRSRRRECIVLGGDIFDFRWSVQGSHAATLEAAQRWLSALLASTDVPIVYLPGNHDCHPDFLECLELLAENETRFLWANHHMQIGDCLFLHGDVLDAGSLQDLAAYRKRFHHEKTQSAIAHRAYDVAVGMRIHKLVPLLRHSPARTCQRLLQIMEQLSLPHEAPIGKIYFGHTHVAIHGIELDGKQFFNPGASLRHMQLHIHEFQADEG